MQFYGCNTTAEAGVSLNIVKIEALETLAQVKFLSLHFQNIVVLPILKENCVTVFIDIVREGRSKFQFIVFLPQTALRF